MVIVTSVLGPLSLSMKLVTGGFPCKFGPNVPRDSTNVTYKQKEPLNVFTHS